MNPTAAILAFAAAPHRLPEAAANDVRRLVRDTLAVAIAGSTAPGTEAVLKAARAMGTGADAPLLGRAERLPAPGAAMVNGFQIHCLEWDAVHEPGVVHAMSVVTAAVHATAHRLGGAEDDDVLAALCVGVEIACLLGVAATTPLRFFRPATAGVMGAALACGRLMGLSNLDDVLGLAHAQAAGTMQAHVEGSIALPVQVALAARAAVTAADLAAAGILAPHDVLEGPFGYMQLFDRGDLAPHVAGLGTAWRVSEISVKPWPSGRASHGLLSVLEGRGKAGRVEAHVPPLVARLVGRPWVDGMTPAYARLCLPFLASLMMVDGHINPRRFTPATFADARLQALGARLSIVVDGNPDLNALSPQRIVVDGESIVVSATPGSPAAPLSAAQQAAKEALALSLAAAPAPFDPLALLTGKTA